MTSFEVRPALPADDPAILNLLRASPQPGRVVLNFEREPSFYFGAQVTCEKPDVLVVLDKQNGELVAVGNLGFRSLYINGEPKNIRYAHDLRVAEPYRGTLALVRLFRQGKKLLAPKEWLQTVILAENQTSLATVGAGRAGLPTYYPHGDIVTYLIFAAPWQRLRHRWTIRRASHDDLPAMQAFVDEQGPKRQFFPCYNLRRILDGGNYFRDIKVTDYWLAFDDDRLVAMTGVWDQKGFKQTRLVQYPRGLAWLRHLYNIWSGLFGGVHLPAEGGCIDYRTLHTLLVRDNDPQLLAALIEPIAREARDDRAALVVAFFSDDKARDALGKFTTQTMLSRHFLMSFDGDPGAELDDRPRYVEVARL